MMMMKKDTLVIDVFGKIKDSRWRKKWYKETSIMQFFLSLFLLVLDFCFFYFSSPLYSENLINEARSQVYTQKNRRAAMVRQSRADIAQLLTSGQYDDALARVDKLHNNERLLCAYGQIGQFGHIVHTNLSEISSRKRLSYEVVEAASSLVFAASRCGELPELHQIRMLFKKHFGANFDRTNVKLQPGNFVNTQIKYNLGSKSLPKNVKIEMIQEIARECNIPLKLDQVRAKKPVPQHESKNSKGKDQVQDSKVKTTLRKMGSKFSMFDPRILIYKCNGKNNVSQRPNALIQTDGYGKPDGSRHKNKMNDQNLFRKLGLSRRSNKSSSSHSSNLHPKLPDYDELVTKFTEYKEEHKKSNPNDRSPRKWMRWF